MVLSLSKKNDACENPRAEIFRIWTGSRRQIENVKRKRGVDNDIYPNACQTDMDSHADTHCFGRNFRPIHWTGQECSVAPFLSEYSQQENIQICTGATAFTLDTGEVIILLFGQGLWFGNRMEKSLINPYQVRAFGIPLCDDPTDLNRQLGIEGNDDCFIRMEMFGSTCGFISRYPTDDEMNTCKHITMSDEQYWDPSRNHFNVSVMQAERNTGIMLSRHILYVDRFNHIQDDIALHDMDRYFATISTSLVSDLLVENIICKVQTRMVRNSYATITEDRHHGVSPELLAQKWGIGMEKAKATLKCTTQKCIRSAILPLTRRYRTDLMSQRLRRLSTTWYTDTLFAKCKSVVGNTCAQMFTDGNSFAYVHPMKTKASAGEALQKITKDVGVPNTLISDGAREQTGDATKFKEVTKKLYIDTRTIEPFSPWQNQAENVIGIIKSKAKRRRIRRQVPKRCWDFGLVWEAEIYCRIAGTDGRTGLERLTGDTPDISEWIDFEFYDLCWYWTNQTDANESKIGRWLGVSHRVGSALCYWILTSTGKVIARTTVQHLTRNEVATADIQNVIRKYHNDMTTAIGSDNFVSDLDGMDDFINDDVDSEDFDDEDEVLDWMEERYSGLPRTPDIDEVVDNSDRRKQADTYDKFINAEVAMPDKDGRTSMGKVVKRVRDNEGKGIGTVTDNPLTNSSLYEVEFPDGHSEELQYNIIAENMMSQVDSEGHHYQILQEISDHKSNHLAIKRSNGFIKSQNGNTHKKMTTRGWKLQVEWKDGSVSWVPLKDLKASNPIELAEYAVANDISDEPAFNWWVTETLRKRDRIVSKIKAKYWRTSHKFGIKVPKTVDEAYNIDRQTGTTFWTEAITKEMKNVRVAFEVLPGITEDKMRDGKVKPGFKYCGTHMIFDIKMDGKFTRKARLVADGHTTDVPSSITYSSVVSRESVRLALMIASLNDLKIAACDIGNAYLNAECREKLWTIAGSEFGSEKGSVMLIVKALYGLKSSGAAWRAKLADTMRSMDYTPTQADPDVWIKRAVKPSGEEYYCYMLVYVDDVLHVHHDPSFDMKRLSTFYRLKDGVGTPDRYLGANIEKVQLCNGKEVWSMTCVDYLKGAIKNVDNMLEESNTALKTFGNGHRPYESSYKPEIDVSQLLSPELINKYQQLIGMLRWSIELGRIDIHVEVSCLSQHLCAPREGHMQAAFKIFRYLQKNLPKNPGRLAFDPTMELEDEKIFEGSSNKEDWQDFYPDAEEAMPSNMLEPLGKTVHVRVWVDANHAGNLANRRSHSGILVYVNNALIINYSKRQNTVESSSFGSELVALRIATDMIEVLRYKLRCFGIPIMGPATVLCDNKSVVTNASVPASVLHKRHNAICYHRVREAQASQMIRVGWIPGEFNKSDLLTKTTMPGNKKNGFVQQIFHNKATVIRREDLDIVLELA